MIAATADECILHTGAGNRLVTQSSYSIGIRAGLSYHRLLRGLSVVSGKLSCCVLRGAGAGDSPCLPGELEMADVIKQSARCYQATTAKGALLSNAAAVVFTHNHPAGVAEPSDADRRLTTHLVEALGLFDIRVLDHIIVCPDSATSFAERGLL